MIFLMNVYILSGTLFTVSRANLCYTLVHIGGKKWNLLAYYFAFSVGLPAQ
jgi:hypothetical protein